MRWERLFPLALILLDIAAGITYASKGDVRHAVYWFAAATLTTCVTF